MAINHNTKLHNMDMNNALYSITNETSRTNNSISK